jgi:iron complex transport system substrate-binding protein
MQTNRWEYVRMSQRLDLLPETDPAPRRITVPEVDAGVTRRRFLAGAGGLLVLGVAGCGGGESGERAGADSGETRVVEHKYGSTEVSGTPKRVATVGLSDHDPVLAIGVKPIAVTEWYGAFPYATWPWAQDALGEAEPEVMPRNNDRINFELLATFEPDLIIGQYSGMSRDDYETASRIAPTIAQSGEYPDYGAPWQAVTRTIGLALRRRGRAEELISGVEERFAEVSQDYPQFEGKAAVVGEFFETFFVRSASDPRTRFLTSLGFVLPEEIAELTGDRDGADISEEQLRLLDRDLLLWNIGFYPQLEGELADNEIYQQLDVPREGRDIFLTDEVLSGALTWSTVLSIPFALDKLAPRLAAAVDGDPETTG